MRSAALSILAALVLAAAPPARAADFAAGKESAQKCVECHGEDGRSRLPGIPNLAGQNELYLVKQLRDFRAPTKPLAGDTAGVRAEPVMTHQAVLSTEEIESLSAWFASRACARTPAPAVGEPPTAVRTTCANCHGTDGIATSPLMPHLAGQKKDYLYEQMKLFRAAAAGPDKGYARPAREHPLMDEIAARYSDAEMREMAAWYAIQPCR